jgi:hypothetical protein
MLRKLLVGSAHYILGPFGKESDLRRLRREDSLPRRQERKETSGGGCSEEACGAFGQPVDKRRTLRSSLQYPSARKAAGGGAAGSSLRRDEGAQRAKLRRR